MRKKEEEENNRKKNGKKKKLYIGPIVAFGSGVYQTPLYVQNCILYNILKKKKNKKKIK